MATAAEKLNNAIVRLDFVTVGAPVSLARKSAIGDLTRAWQLFWDSGERHLLPDAALTSRYAGFAAWYARAWLLLPPAQRKLCVDPREIDTSFLSVSEATIASALDSYQAAGEAAADAARNVGEGLKGTGSWILWAGGIAAAVLVAYGYAQSSTARAAAA